MIVVITGFVGDTEPPAVFEQVADSAILKLLLEERFPVGRLVIYKIVTI